MILYCIYREKARGLLFVIKLKLPFFYGSPFAFFVLYFIVIVAWAISPFLFKNKYL